jgi:hypothetical protein
MDDMGLEKNATDGLALLSSGWEAGYSPPPTFFFFFFL